MKQNKLLKAAFDRQKATNINMRDFFARNDTAEWSKKTVNEKYVLTQVSHGAQKDITKSSEYIEEESSNSEKAPSRVDFNAGSRFPKSDPIFITGTNFAPLIAALETKELP